MRYPEFRQDQLQKQKVAAQLNIQLLFKIKNLDPKREIILFTTNQQNFLVLCLTANGEHFLQFTCLYIPLEEEEFFYCNYVTNTLVLYNNYYILLKKVYQEVYVLLITMDWQTLKVNIVL